MAGKQVDLPANIAEMSENQLYEIMSQMKTLIEQNQQQARQILIQNPLLAKALFQAGGLHIGSEFGNQVGGSMQVDRGSSWMSSQPDNSTLTRIQGPPTLVSSQTGTGNQPPHPASSTPEMEKALLQQVMSLTPEQINLLPPEQRNQVLQLQQILRQSEGSTLAGHELHQKTD